MLLLATPGASSAGVQNPAPVSYNRGPSPGDLIWVLMGLGGHALFRSIKYPKRAETDLSLFSTQAQQQHTTSRLHLLQVPHSYNSISQQTQGQKEKFGPAICKTRKTKASAAVGLWTMSE